MSFMIVLSKRKNENTFNIIHFFIFFSLLNQPAGEKIMRKKRGKTGTGDPMGGREGGKRKRKSEERKEETHNKKI